MYYNSDKTTAYIVRKNAVFYVYRNVILNAIISRLSSDETDTIVNVYVNVYVKGLPVVCNKPRRVLLYDIRCVLCDCLWNTNP